MNFSKFLLLKYHSIFNYFTLVIIFYLCICLILLPYNSSLLKILILICFMLSYLVYIIFGYLNYNYKHNSDVLNSTLNSNKKQSCFNTKNSIPWYFIYIIVLTGWVIGLYFLTSKTNPNIFSNVSVPINIPVDREYNIFKVALSLPLLILFLFSSSLLTNLKNLNPLLDKLSNRYNVILTPDKSIINIAIGIIVLLIIVMICLNVDLGDSVPSILALAVKGIICFLLLKLFLFYYNNYNTNFQFKNYFNILNHRRFNFETSS